LKVETWRALAQRLMAGSALTALLSNHWYEVASWDQVASAYECFYITCQARNAKDIMF